MSARPLEAAGATPARAIAAAALVGPAQVAARLIEFGLLTHLHPVIAARIAATLHPAGAAFLVLFGAPRAVFFALLPAAPLLFGVLLDDGGPSLALACSGGLSLAAMVALLPLRSR